MVTEIYVPHNRRSMFLEACHLNRLPVMEIYSDTDDCLKYEVEYIHATALYMLGFNTATTEHYHLIKQQPMYETTLIGHVGKDAIVSQVGENSVINFTVAVTEKWLDGKGVKNEKTIWFDCSMFRQKTVIADYLKKGQMVYIRGKIGLNQWVGQSGEQRVSLTLRVDELELIGKKDAVVQEPVETPPVTERPVKKK